MKNIDRDCTPESCSACLTSQKAQELRRHDLVEKMKTAKLQFIASGRPNGVKVNYCRVAEFPVLGGGGCIVYEQDFRDWASLQVNPDKPSSNPDDLVSFREWADDEPDGQEFSPPVI